MAFSKALVALLLALAATAVSVAGQSQPPSCDGHKVTVQNLCDHDLRLNIEPLANSKLLFSNGYLLPRGTHREFPVCAWTGRVKLYGADMVEFHLGHEGGGWYQLTPGPTKSTIPVSCTPHGKLQGHCPTAGCTRSKCFEHSVPGGNCHGVSEMKIVYCST
ncbi:hypothetical protein ACQ4PT_049549 [Festuca glaucescens]